MLDELLRLGADPNTAVMTNFKLHQKNSPLYAAVVNHGEATMFFAKQLMDFGAKFSEVCDSAPLVAAMRGRVCIDVIDLFEDNVAALGRTQNMHDFRENGNTAMHYFLKTSLEPFFATEHSLHAIKHHVEVLNKKLLDSMRITNNSQELPSAIVKEALKKDMSDAQKRCMEDLLKYVSDLEKYEPIRNTISAEMALTGAGLPRELVDNVCTRYLDPRFAQCQKIVL
jgi:hypothetical protein